MFLHELSSFVINQFLSFNVKDSIKNMPEKMFLSILKAIGAEDVCMAAGRSPEMKNPVMRTIQIADFYWYQIVVLFQEHSIQLSASSIQI